MTSSNDIIIEATDLTVGYENLNTLENASFHVKRGEVFVILGGSGCGKTTLLKHLIGLYTPKKGKILVHGQDINQSTLKEKQKLMRGFGVLYQTGALFGSLTVGENISLPLEEYTDNSKAQRDEIIAQKLALVGMEGTEKLYPSELSGGMKKRAGLARAMVLNPDLLFFDEPTSGLDPISAARLDALIVNLSRKFNTTMVVVTHDLDSIFAIADRAIMLDTESTEIIAIGSPKEIQETSKSPTVQNFLNRVATTVTGEEFHGRRTL